MISAQLICANLRGLVGGVITGILAVVLIPTFVTDMSVRQMVATFVIAAAPAWLTFLGFGSYDTHRANLGHVIDSDVAPLDTPGATNG